MKNFFDFKRFINLIRLFFVVQGKALSLCFVLTFVVLVLVLNFIFYVGSSYSDLRYFIFFIYLIVNMSIIVGVAVQEFKKKSTLSTYLVIPNSILEKTLIYVFVHGLFFMMLTIFLFWIGDCIVIKKIIPPFWFFNNTEVQSVVGLMSFGKYFYSVMGIVLFFHCFGSFTFFIINKKIKALVGLAFVGVLIGGSVLLNYLIFSSVPLKSYIGGPFGRMQIKNNYNNWKDNYYLLESDLTDGNIYLCVLLPMCLFGVAIYYFKLKEQEV